MPKPRPSLSPTRKRPLNLSAVSQARVGAFKAFFESGSHRATERHEARRQALLSEMADVKVRTRAGRLRLKELETSVQNLERKSDSAQVKALRRFNRNNARVDTLSQHYFGEGNKVRVRIRGGKIPFHEFLTFEAGHEFPFTHAGHKYVASLASDSLLKIEHYDARGHIRRLVYKKNKEGVFVPHRH